MNTPRPDLIKHGHTSKYLQGNGKASRIYLTWVGMIQRCTNPNSPDYRRYGARGVVVCEKWRAFEGFLDDMGERPVGKTIDRWPNPRGNYQKDNCRWATPTEQNHNRLDFQTLTFNGKTLSLADWATHLRGRPTLVKSRLRTGWTLEEALSMPCGIRGKHHRTLELPGQATKEAHEI